VHEWWWPVVSRLLPASHIEHRAHRPTTRLQTVKGDVSPPFRNADILDDYFAEIRDAMLCCAPPRALWRASPGWNRADCGCMRGLWCMVRLQLRPNAPTQLSAFDRVSKGLPILQAAHGPTRAVGLSSICPQRMSPVTDSIHRSSSESSASAPSSAIRPTSTPSAHTAAAADTRSHWRSCGVVGK
jgi:hypothetical protein